MPEEYKIKYVWQNESSGTIHEGTYEGSKYQIEEFLETLHEWYEDSPEKRWIVWTDIEKND